MYCFIVFCCDLGGSVAAIVTNVSVPAGSLLWGRRVTIVGRGFGINAGENAVRVRGAPCTVVSAESTRLVCVAGEWRPSRPETTGFVTGTALMELWGGSGCGCECPTSFFVPFVSDPPQATPAITAWTSRLGRDWTDPMRVLHSAVDNTVRGPSDGHLSLPRSGRRPI